MEKVTLKLSQDGVCKVAQNTTGLLIEGTIYVPYMEMPKVEGAPEVSQPTAKSSAAEPFKAKKESKKDPKDALIEIFDKMDAAELNVKQAVKAIVKLGYDEDLAKKVATAHDEDEESESAVSAEAILNPKPAKKAAKKVEDDDDEEEEEKPAKKSAKKSAKKVEEDEDEEDDEEDESEEEDEFVDASDLKKGDKVSVFWVDEDDWFNGVVKSTKGKVIISYEDDTEFPLDEKNNPKIKKLD